MSRKSIYAILLLSLLLFSSSCSHTAQRREARVLVQDIKIGETTEKDIQKLFGNPNYFGAREDKTWWLYVFVNKEGYKTLSLYFNEEGKVHDFYFSPKQ